MRNAAGGKVGLRVYNAVALFDNIAVYSGVVAPEGAEQAEDLTLAGTTPEIKDPEIFVNQIGYDNGTSMRATIPNADGKEFRVVNRATGEAAYGRGRHCRFHRSDGGHGHDVLYHLRRQAAVL